MAVSAVGERSGGAGDCPRRVPEAIDESLLDASGEWAGGSTSATVREEAIDAIERAFLAFA